MEEVRALTTIDLYSIFVSVFIVLIGIKAVVSVLEWTINKLGLETKWMRKKREEHELIIRTSQNLSALQQKHMEDVKQSIIHDKRIQEKLSTFMEDMKASITETQNQLKQFAENRVRDREQSMKIQQELSDAIKTITDNAQMRDKQIDALICGNKELLNAEMDKHYRQPVCCCINAKCNEQCNRLRGKRHGNKTKTQ